jgi:hypothetical protein
MSAHGDSCGIVKTTHLCVSFSLSIPDSVCGDGDAPISVCDIGFLCFRVIFVGGLRGTNQRSSALYVVQDG